MLDIPLNNKKAMGVYFVEGYGQTENCAAGAGTLWSNYCVEDGCVGKCSIISASYKHSEYLR